MHINSQEIYIIFDLAFGKLIAIAEKTIVISKSSKQKQTEHLKAYVAWWSHT